MKTTRTSTWDGVPCVLCGAEPGKSCKKFGGDVAPHHAVRGRAAQALERAADAGYDDESGITPNLTETLIATGLIVREGRLYVATRKGLEALGQPAEVAHG